MGIPREHRIGRYELLVELGRGGMAELFLGRLVGAGGFAKLVAIKRILPHLAGDPQWRQMFLDEGRIAAHLSHPNVCQVFELDETDQGELYLVMEYLDGVPWQHLLAETPREHALPLTAGVLSEAAEGLHYAHELRDALGRPTPIVHRDVSPQNLFVTVDGSCKVLDFGVSKMMTDGPRTRSGVVKGKLPYMSPEQIRGDEGIDGRADVFSLGVCAWEALTGARLYDRPTDFQIWKAITEEDPPPITSRWPACPVSVEGLVRCALDRDPGRRPPSARAFAEELRQVAGAVAGSAEIATAVRTRCAAKLEARAREIAAVLHAQADDDPSASVTIERRAGETAILAAHAPGSMVVRRHAVAVTRDRVGTDDAAVTRELPHGDDAPGMSRDAFGDPAVTAPELPSEKRRLRLEDPGMSRDAFGDPAITAPELPSEKRRLRLEDPATTADVASDKRRLRVSLNPEHPSGERQRIAVRDSDSWPGRPRARGSHARTAIIAAVVAAAVTAVVVVIVTRRSSPSAPVRSERAETPPDARPPLARSLEALDELVKWGQRRGAITKQDLEGTGLGADDSPAEPDPPADPKASEPAPGPTPAHPATKPPAAPPAPASKSGSARAPAPAVAKAPGLLSISSKPFASIYVDDNLIGDTPLFRHSISAGKHQIHAVLADGRERTFTVEISSGVETNAGTLAW